MRTPIQQPWANICGRMFRGAKRDCGRMFRGAEGDCASLLIFAQAKVIVAAISLLICCARSLVAQDTFGTDGAQQPASSTAPASDSASASANARAYDIVEYVGLADKPRAWQPRTSFTVHGEIRQCDDQRVAMIDVDGSPRTIPSPQIVRIDPKWRNAAAAEAHQAFVQRKYRVVLATVPEALQSNLVQWQQRLLIAELVHAATAMGKPREAGHYFLSLAKSNPPHLLYADMPLCWTVCEPDESFRVDAQKWLTSSDDAARLLGASWLLFGESSAQAKQALAQLQKSTHTAIAQIATLQGWRLTPPPQTMTQLKGWFDYRDQLIPPLQLGPTEFLADRLMRIGQHDLAIGQWLRIASQHGDRPHRVHQALQSASGVLERLGHEQEVQRLEAWIEKLAAEN